METYYSLISRQRSYTVHQYLLSERAKNQIKAKNFVKQSKNKKYTIESIDIDEFEKQALVTVKLKCTTHYGIFDNLRYTFLIGAIMKTLQKYSDKSVPGEYKQSFTLIKMPNGSWRVSEVGVIGKTSLAEK